MSKVNFADEITVGNCECCGSVHVQLRRKGKLFAVAVPASAESAAELTADLQAAVKVMQDAGGKPHVH